MLWESIRNKITRKIVIFYLGGWKAPGIPKGDFGHVLARKAKNGEKFLSAGSTGLTAQNVEKKLASTHQTNQFCCAKNCSRISPSRTPKHSLRVGWRNLSLTD
jgi:hypothetical protein